MFTKISWIPSAVAACALLVLSSPLALCAPIAPRADSNRPAVSRQVAPPSARPAPVTQADLERLLAQGDFVSKKELERFATKTEVAELRAQMESLRTRLDALKARRRRGDLPATSPAPRPGPRETP